MGVVPFPEVVSPFLLTSLYTAALAPGETVNCGPGDTVAGARGELGE